MNRSIFASMLVLAAVVSARSEEAAPAAADEFKISGDAAKGAETYKMYCATCHGETGKGDGVGAAALNPKPRDFTDKAVMAAIPDSEVFKAIKEGGAAVGKSPMMIAWGMLLKEDQQIHDVAAYVRSLGQ